MSIINFLEHKYKIQGYSNNTPYGQRNTQNQKFYSSQILYDIDRLVIDKSKNGYTKGEFLIQNYSELEADSSLFDFSMAFLTFLKKENNICNVMISLANSSIKSFKLRGIDNVICVEYFITREISMVGELNNKLHEWNKEKDKKLRRIFLDCT